ncbi:tRNA (guanosine(46)-N7)-methyltransferase TrmB [Sulfobacillus acidophilus]|uniref:tRNA (guanine-N(7)-)-methyltransferase n=1 Tax=Sulfobacillus acidophilus TaxID=53633 RepID=A0ABS3AWK5_9FIRM|nr:tRNA (guanosine(46)-N7)-methyltransferase TrmB [Sulfobacillus acidophilus]
MIDISKIPTEFTPEIAKNPPKWEDIFSQKKPLELEIGTGRPHFLFERAKSISKHNIVGIEYKEQWIKQALRKIKRENIKNVHAIHGDAWILIPKLFEKNSISAIFLNFPDPWWKKRHQKRRILNANFVDLLVKKMKKDAIFFFQTDVFQIFEIYHELLASHNLLAKKELNKDIDIMANSHREKKCKEYDLPIYRALFKKL